MKEKELYKGLGPADYETVQKEKQREERQKQFSEQQYRQMQRDVIDNFAGASKEKRAVVVAAFKGVEYARIAAEQGEKEALKQAKKDGIDLGLRGFNTFLKQSINIVDGLTTEFQRMPDPKRFGKDKIRPVFSYQYEGEQGGFGAEYNPLYKTGRVSGGMKLGPGRLTGEAAVSPYGKSVGARFTTKFNKGGKVYNRRGQPRKVKY
tara:strand:- start:5 stop:622 length:618 start_codon:yes stop_codon:yes gene_type:complete